MNVAIIGTSATSITSRGFAEPTDCATDTTACCIDNNSGATYFEDRLFWRSYTPFEEDKPSRRNAIPDGLPKNPLPEPKDYPLRILSKMVPVRARSCC